MQEVLSKPEVSNKPLHEQVFFSLHLVDLHESWKPLFKVVESRFAWSEIDGRFMGDRIATETLAALEQARKRYEDRRLDLVHEGFVLSDLDF